MSQLRKCDLCKVVNSSVSSFSSTYLGIYVTVDLCGECEYEKFRDPLYKVEQECEQYVQKRREKVVYPILRKVGITDLRTVLDKGIDNFLGGI